MVQRWSILYCFDNYYFTMKIYYTVILLISLLSFNACQNNMMVLNTDLLVIGGGASGTMAGIQASRMGVNTIITEETDWLGGMLTSAGVSAIDGDHNLPSGLWGEFRSKLYAHYGGPEEVSTGWVSNTLFEPHVGAEILLNMAKSEKKLNLFFHYRFLRVIKKNNTVTGAYFENLEDHATIKIQSKITIDATELGDVLANAGCAYNVGMEYNELNGESYPGESSKNTIQDLTYVAILKDYGPGSDKTIQKPDHYDPGDYQCCCREACTSDSFKLIECAKMLTYGQLPNHKYMINWPNHGNDYYVNLIEMTPQQRETAIQPAKDYTLGFVYYIQTVLGYKNLGLADDEFDSKDLLPYIPYHRESTRLQGMVRFTINDMISPYDNSAQPLYKTAIAVGDYPIDHHHDMNPNAPEVHFPPIPSFGVPIGCLVPRKINGLIVAEKSISVSHIANGATRLQPVVMQLGQAAGALAAECLKKEIEPRHCDIRTVQTDLLNAGCWLLPFIDVKPTDHDFKILQQAGVSGILKGTGIPYKWANQTWLYPDSLLTKEALRFGIEQITGNFIDLPDLTNTNVPVTLFQFVESIESLINQHELILNTGLNKNDHDVGSIVRQSWEKWQLASKYDKNSHLTRRQFAVITHYLFEPFSKPMDFDGHIKTP